tara:strand:+ start:2510 stop:3109 length:600 start_codon:yes stop_codon:yes gene_type:complete
MYKLSYRYNQTASKLVVEGLPDISLGHEPDIIGIISSWSLSIVGSPILEGKRENLDSLISVILPYARYSISGIRKTFTSNDNLISITPYEDFHQLILKSTKRDIDDLVINLDDACFSDLLRCLDDLVNDTRVIINWTLYHEKPLKTREFMRPKTLVSRSIPLFLAITSFVFTSMILISLPIPNLEIIEPKDLKESKTNS